MAETVAKAIAANLDVPFDRYEFTLPKNREDEVIFGQGDLVVLGTPVIAGRVPNLLLPYLKEKIKGKGALGVPVVSFGNRDFDDALIELRDMMEVQGFQTIAGGAFVSEHSFSHKLGAGRPDEKDCVMLREFGTKIAEKLKNGWTYSYPAFVKGQEPIRSYFTPRDRHEVAIDIRKVKPKTGANCCDCGICAAVCPMGAISREDVTKIPGTCMKCCACIKKCPVNAKFFDDEGFIYHKEELEELYERRKEAEYFL